MFCILFVIYDNVQLLCVMINH